MTSTNWLDLLNEAKANGGPQDFGPIPPGEYKFKVLSAEARSTANGKPKYTIKAQVQDGPHANRLVWDDLIVSIDSAPAMGFFFRKMAALGLGKEFFATQPTDQQITDGLTGRDFLGLVIIDNFGGKDRNKINGYKPLAAAPQGFIPPAPQAAAPAPAPAPQQAPAQQYAAPAPTQQPPAAQPPQYGAPAPTPSAAPWDNAPQQQQYAPAPTAAPWDNQQAAPAQAPVPQQVQIPDPPF